ncbi:hypothetical protein PENTCL1PPCAC_11285 [Pristionchus entomophagus]|uniref:Uncharacterized protein n=1 Tax=Pristionchus entomophagus TaxID=358040 RepID=A0AAV5T212_9BILA|nr:hypothetical protein PENTCL1PPCAC_11285 [Pristionchus entomophagus]
MLSTLCRIPPYRKPFGSPQIPGWTEEWQGDFWRSLGEICLWPSFIIVVVLMIVGLSKLLTDLYLSSMSNKDEKSEVAPKTQQSAEKSDYVDTFNNDNQEYDRDGIYDFEHTITFGPIKK